MSLIDIIIPTYNLPEYSVPCVQSIIRDFDGNRVHVYVINNGEKEHEGYFPHTPNVTILNQEENLGWEGGLKAGLSYSQAPYVVFMNDDTFVPVSSSGWLDKLLGHFTDPGCAAVGPSSNVVMGHQQMFMPSERPFFMTNFLIGLCMMVRRSDLDAVGGVDDTLPGGDDLDLSIRLRKAGKYLVCDKRVFIYHHGFKTGERVHGTDWNSLRMLEATNFALIRKHGIRSFQNLFSGPPWDPDQEGRLIASMISPDQATVDLGCGTRKTVPWAVGYDILPSGTFVPNVFPKGTSVADVVADVTQPLPIDPESKDVVIARHVLEHMEDVNGVLQNWSKVLKHGGRLILALPNDVIGYTKDMDPDHKQAFTPESFKKMMEDNGFKVKNLLDPNNNVSFVAVCEKNGLQKA